MRHTWCGWKSGWRPLAVPRVRSRSPIRPSMSPAKERFPEDVRLPLSLDADCFIDSQTSEGSDTCIATVKLVIQAPSTKEVGQDCWVILLATAEGDVITVHLGPGEKAVLSPVSLSSTNELPRPFSKKREKCRKIKKRLL